MSDAKEKAQAFGFSGEDVRAALEACSGKAFATGGEMSQDFVLDLGIAPTTSPAAITEQMIEAGINALEEVAEVSYLPALAAEVYSAMEAARQKSQGGADMLARVHTSEAILPNDFRGWPSPSQ